MKYKDLKEFNVKDWDGKPFTALPADITYDELSEIELSHLRNPDGATNYLNIIVGFVDGKWKSKSGLIWAHVYRLKDNKIEPQRMTNRELSRWLAQGNGERWEIHSTHYGNYFNYPKFCGNFEVVDTLRVRPWDSDEWVVPTKDLLK